MSNSVLMDKDENILNPKIPRYENLKNYLDEEQIIGKWEEETLYRKVVNFDYFPNNGQRIVPTNISNLKDVKWYEYSWYDDSDKRFFSSLRFDNNTTYCKVSTSHTDLVVEGRGVDWSSRTSQGKCIIYYTKTTN